MFDSHSQYINFANLDMVDQEHIASLLTGTRLLFIDDDYVNFLYFRELLEGTGAEIIRAISVSQAIYKLKYAEEIKMVFISAVFAESFNYAIIRFLKDKFSFIPVVTIVDDLSVEAQAKCIEEGSDYYIDRHIDSDHLVESIIDNLTLSHYNKYSHR